MAPTETAFRELVQTWFGNSSLFETLKGIARTNAAVVLTTDHGSVRGTRASVVHGDRDTSSNLRYKYGRNLRCEQKDALMIPDPEAYGLPSGGRGSTGFPGPASGVTWRRVALGGMPRWSARSACCGSWW